MITLDLSEAIGVTEQMAERLRAIEDLLKHAKPLMQSIERRISDGNRAGILAGLDKDGNPAPPLSYRPRNARPMTVGERLGQRENLRRGKYAGKGSYGSFGVMDNNNLTTSAYQQLDGPRLAPRYQYSRSITNFGTHSGRLLNGDWLAVGAWVEVVSKKGFHFLPVHFDGKPLGKNGPSKRYDLRDPAGRHEAHPRGHGALGKAGDPRAVGKPALRILGESLVDNEIDEQIRLLFKEAGVEVVKNAAQSFDVLAEREKEAAKEAVKVSDATRATDAVLKTGKITLDELAGKGAGESGSGGFAGLTRNVLVAERAIGALATGQGLARAGTMLESVLTAVGGPAGIGFLIGSVALAAERYLPMLIKHIEGIGGGTAEALKKVEESLDKMAEHYKSVVDGLAKHVPPGMEKEAKAEGGILGELFNAKTLIGPDAIQHQLESLAVMSQFSAKTREQIDAIGKLREERDRLADIRKTQQELIAHPVLSRPR